MSAKIETAEETAARLWPTREGLYPGCIADAQGREYAATAIRARDAQIAAWCEEAAGKAEREGEARLSIVSPSRTPAENEEHLSRYHRCEGQASALRSLAAILKGGAP